MRYSVLSRYRSELMGAAMLWVMLYHAWDLSTGLEWADWLLRAGFGGVDVFIVLSAMGLVCSLSRRERDFSSFMSRRASRVLPAYYAVMLPYTTFSILRGKAPLSALLWNSTLLYYWVHSLGRFNWYIAGIMTFYALTPFCFRRLRRSRRRELWALLGSLLGLLCCWVLIADGYWNHLDIFYRIPSFCTGLLLGFYVAEDRALAWKDVLFWCACTAAGAVYAAAMLLNTSGLYLPPCHLFIFTTVPMCLSGCLCFERLPLGWARRALRLVGENSLEIYLLNVSFFSERKLLRRWLCFRPWFYWLIVFALNILLGVLLHRAIAAAGKRLAGVRTR